MQYGARSSESKPRVRRPAKRLARGRGDVREQLLGVGGGLGGGVGVREPPARVQQLAQHGRHALDATARLAVGNKGRESARLGRRSLRLRRLPSRRGCAPERARPWYVTYSSPLPQAPQQEQERPWP